DPEQELEIRIEPDKDNKILKIADTGIGMSKDELISNLGTIAKSGTEEFMKQVAEDKENPDNIIGRFGVGFYSVFMVADQVRIKSKSARKDEPAVTWISDGINGYEIGEPDSELKRGTLVEITLKEDCQEYLEPETIKSIIKRHSNFISFPIYVDQEKVNTVAALWKESKFNISKEQYNEFYKFLTLDSDDPLETIHISVDAPVQFNSLLFIPKKSTFLFETFPSEYGLDLYVNRVLIEKSNQDIIPQYLGFVKGIVDSEDLPLNLSRQAIQESALIRKINTTLAKQVLTQLERLAANDEDRYTQFWREHGRIFKLGYTDFGNQDKFAKLLRFNSSWHEDNQGLTSLKAYSERMKTGQKEIYYISGSSREEVLSNPHLEMLAGKGLEVLYLYEPIDEFVMQSLGTFEDFQVKAAEHVNPQDLEGFAAEGKAEEEPLKEEEEKPFEDLLAKMKEILGDRVTEVKASKRLQNSPACLVNPEGGISSQMQKIMQAMNKDGSIPKQILEVNPQHGLNKNLLKVYRRNPEDEYVKKFTEQLFETTLLQAGYLADPHAMVSRSFELLKDASNWYAEVNQL
ncbi:MAG: molecular chaperone HtpG, partial [Desulfohalobiaceae bacterium]|nr:molecular chaperone HtpG [Desulfohalobiaceae bacterium]